VAAISPVPRFVRLAALFALAVCLVVGAAAFWTVWRLERALERELGGRLEAVAVAGATAIDARQLVELAADGPEGLAYGRLQLDMELVRTSSDANDVFLVRRDGTVLFDLMREGEVGRRSPLFAAERAAATAALAGSPASTRLYRAGELMVKTGFAPVRRADGEALAVVGVEAGAGFLRVLAETRRNLLLALLPALAAVLLLSGLFVRLSLARQRLEREYARGENLAAVGELSATLAHEVRDPLGIIKRSAERLRRHYQGPEPELLDYVTEECDRLADTVRRYLDFSRPAAVGERGGDAEAALRATAALLEPECRERQVDLSVAVEGGGPWRVALGAEPLRQALLNLMRNSLEAFAAADGAPPEGSRPAAGVAERRRRLAARLARAPHAVSLEIADNGPGMDRDTLRRARELLFTTRAQGSGLAIVERLVRDSGGRVRVASAPGRGTAVTLLLKPAPEEGSR
jgi:signal transduction histidine kinase